MREILFRGKRVDNGEWAYGNLIEDKWGDDNGNTVYAILQDRVAPEIAALWTPVRVAPETVGEYTGLKDKNGKKIFEGDIVELTYYTLPKDRKVKAEVAYKEEIAAFVLYPLGAENEGISLEIYNIEKVIGNIYDNFEL